MVVVEEVLKRKWYWISQKGIKTHFQIISGKSTSRQSTQANCGAIVVNSFTFSPRTAKNYLLLEEQLYTSIRGGAEKEELPLSSSSSNMSRARARKWTAISQAILGPKRNKVLLFVFSPQTLLYFHVLPGSCKFPTFFRREIMVLFPSRSRKLARSAASLS
jgi:hypothetical protein